LIYKRHSVRRYADAPFSPEQADHVLHAAMAAPSANNKQPWSFVVVDERKTLDAIAELHPYARMMKGASFAVVPCVIRDIALSNPFYPQDMGASVENMLLAAVECGLGSCWCGVHPKEELERGIAGLLGLPDTVFPFAVVAFGALADDPSPSDRFDESRVHRNAW
jgi:nitroreductase